MFLQQLLHVLILAQQPSATASQPLFKCADKIETRAQAGGLAGCPITVGEKRDPQREKLRGAMVLLQQEALRALDLPFEGTHLALYDSTDPSFKGPKGSTRYYAFFAGDEESFEEYIPPDRKCAFQKGYAVAGVLVAGVAGPRLRVTATVLPHDDPALLQICRGLGSRAEWATTEPGTPKLSNFEMIADASDSVTIALYPSEVSGSTFEERTLRAFWSGLLTSMSPTEVARTLMRENRWEATLENIQKTGRFAFTIDMKRNIFAPVSPLDEETLSVFGAAAQKMDDGWLTFLRRASVQKDGVQRPAIENGKVSLVLRRFKLTELGGSSFWSRLSEGNAYIRSVNCLATVFSVDHQYGNVQELPSYRQCASTAKVAVESGSH